MSAAVPLTRRLGIVMNGVTGRMGRNQHLLRSILAIIGEGGVRGRDALWMPDPILVGRSAAKLRDLAERLAPEHVGRPLRWTTDVRAAIADPADQVFFDASTTKTRAGFVAAAAAAGKAIYCEKPTAVAAAEALRLAELCRAAGVKHGVVQDKLFLPGIRKLRRLIDDGFFGRLLSVRGEFGYWVFTGHDPERPAQRPSWNYRAEDGGGITLDMFCHWRYLIDHVFAPVTGVFARVATEIPERVDEAGRPYRCTADDAAYAVFTAGDGLTLQFNSSWTTRVRRDDLLTLQVDGTEGSAVAGLRECRVQRLAATPQPVWNPDLPGTIDFYAGWEPVAADPAGYDNAFKVQWQAFIRHVVDDAPWNHDLVDGARGVQLAELGLRAAREGRFLEVPPLG